MQLHNIVSDLLAPKNSQDLFKDKNSKPDLNGLGAVNIASFIAPHVPMEKPLPVKEIPPDAVTSKQTVMMDFLKQLHAKCGVKPEELVQAMQSLPVDQLKRPPEQTMNLVLARLSIEPEKMGVARKLYEEMLTATARADALQDKGRSGKEPLFNPLASAAVGMGGIAGQQLRAPVPSPAAGSEVIANKIKASPSPLNFPPSENLPTSNVAGAKDAKQTFELPQQSANEIADRMVKGSKAADAKAAPIVLNKSVDDKESIPSPQVDNQVPSEQVNEFTQNSAQSSTVTNPSSVTNQRLQIENGMPVHGQVKSAVVFTSPTHAAEATVKASKPAVTAMNLQAKTVQHLPQHAPIPTSPEFKTQPSVIAKASHASAPAAAGIQAMGAGAQGNDSLDSKQGDSHKDADSSVYNANSAGAVSTQNSSNVTNNFQIAGAAIPGNGVHSEDMTANIQRLMQNAQVLISKGGGEVKVQLHPAGLGQVHLKVHLHQGLVQVEMTTDNQDAKKILEAGMHDLRSQFSANSLRLDTIKIGMTHDASLDPKQQQQQQHQQNNFQFQQEAQREFAQNFMNGFNDQSQARQESMFDTLPAPPSRPRPARTTISSVQGPRRRNGRLNLIA